MGKTDAELLAENKRLREKNRELEQRFVEMADFMATTNPLADVLAFKEKDGVLQMLVSKPKYSEVQVQQRLREQRHDLEQEVKKTRNLFDPVRQAAERVDNALAAVFASLHFSSDPNWKSGLKRLQNNYTNEVTTALNTIQGTFESSPYELQFTLTYMENELKIASGSVNEAIKMAIGGSDGGLALQHLAKKADSPLADLLQQRLFEIETDQIARDRRFDRHKIFIGIQCNLLERDGIKNVDDQWKAVFFKLNAHRESLTGDALEAYKYFKTQKPHDMTSIERRSFEKEISSFRRITAVYIP